MKSYIIILSQYPLPEFGQCHVWNISLISLPLLNTLWLQFSSLYYSHKNLFKMRNLICHSILPSTTLLSNICNLKPLSDSPVAFKLNPTFPTKDHCLNPLVPAHPSRLLHSPLLFSELQWHWSSSISSACHVSSATVLWTCIVSLWNALQLHPLYLPC